MKKNNFDEVETLTEEEIEETVGGGFAEPVDLVQANTPVIGNRNFKYTTTEPEIALTDLTQRLGKIDNIQVINNPINAKISCNDNLISIENQGVYGLVQMQVSGHSEGESKESHIENIFVELNSEDEEDGEDMYLEDLYDDEAEDVFGGGTALKGRTTVSKKLPVTSNKVNDYLIHCGGIRMETRSSIVEVPRVNARIGQVDKVYVTASSAALTTQKTGKYRGPSTFTVSRKSGKLGLVTLELWGHRTGEQENCRYMVLRVQFN